MAVSKPLFSLFCFASYLLSLSYGSTFLLALLVGTQGGNEQDAGHVISAAMLSTFAAVLVSGHLSDRLGAARSIALCGLALVVANIGFAVSASHQYLMMMFGLLLGVGWGVFYTLGPIIVAMIVPPAQRARYFALLSGSMMSGIGSAPLVGRLASQMGLPVTATFYVAALASLIGVALFWRMATALGQLPNRFSAAVSRLSWQATQQVLGSRALFPILMVGLGGAIFGGLSSFQTSYAHEKALDYSLFFIGFMSAAIAGRMFVAGLVVRRDPYRMSCLLSGLIVVSMLMFTFVVAGSLAYILAAIVLGIGYGLTYSVINGLAANEAPEGTTTQSLLLFSLSYFVGVFGFPLLAGKVIIDQGLPMMLLILLGISLLNWSITLGRLVWRKARLRSAMA
ncbi:MAG: MFS transporter [Candidatus Pseudomonas phytovorans]|uniref:MFS transporter n=1 Tax=Candidatus Pseudomonas phytovorans TaxID=3121377 RepID=A0AAJ5WEK6_9PSED|nr:MFS transporter [Pseudomonas sp.]WEK29365.1 MAG: MFS transporter [Pseudomonas sp.]